VNVDLDSYARKDGKSRLRITVYRNGKLRRFPLDVLVKPSLWDAVHKRVKIGDPMHTAYNRAIASTLQRAQTLALDNPQWTADEIVEALERPASNGVRLSEAIATVIRERGDRFSAQTRDRLRFYIGATAEALPLASVEGLTAQDVSRFRSYLSGRGCGQNTIRNRMKMLRTLVNHACSHYGIPKPHVWEGAIPREVDVEERSMTPQQFDRLMAYKPPARLQLAKDAFVLQVFLGGMRFGDLWALTPDRITDEGLSIRQGKTKTVVHASIGETARAIIERYKGGPKVLPLAPQKASANKTVNDHLKLIAAACDLPEDLSTHYARHAAADKLEALGVDIRTIQLLFGHSTLQQTVDYLAKRKGKEAGKALKGMG